ncbi:MAG: hypothetical protein AAF748_15035 [Pseudomonadota bacterium]
MPPARLGLIYCGCFVTIEAFQAVFLGGVFQSVSAFMIGAWVFGLSTAACTAAVVITRPQQIRAVLTSWRLVAALNGLTALTWTAYFAALTLVEPAVVFTLFSGALPLATRLAGAAGMPEAHESPSRGAKAGYGLILLAMAALCATSAAGFAGFTRGSAWIALAGAALAITSGACTAFVILYSARLNRRGIGPMAQFGLRYWVYTLLAIGVVYSGLDPAPAPQAGALAWVVALGLITIAFPLYLVQKAVPLVPAPTIAAITALGPVLVFAMQAFDGRISFSAATLAGLILYSSGAVLLAGAISRTSYRPASQR